MASPSTKAVPPEHELIQAGNSCLLCASGRRFQVTVLKRTSEQLRISFPVLDYLVPGMRVDLEFHREDGYIECQTYVLRAPKEKGDPAALEMPKRVYWNVHRGSNRIPTDLIVHVREDEHPRRYDADLLNVSTGGALIRTRAPLTVPETIETTLSLPGEQQYTVRGRVVHTDGTGVEDPRMSDSTFGVQFVDLAEDVHQAILRYIAGVLADKKD